MDSFEEKRKSFKARCNEAIAGLDSVLEIETNQGPKSLAVKNEIKTTVGMRTWTIYKRNPSGTFNKPIVLGCTREEAIKEYNRLVALEQKKRQAAYDSHEDDVRMGVIPLSKIHKDVYYFDMVASDATVEEKSIYYNPKPTTVEV